MLITAFVVGFVTLAFELAASRVVAPYLGNTIYIWTSIIGVILASLAAGYALGGRLADKRHSYHDVTLLLMLAAFGMFAVYIFKDGLLSMVGRSGLNLQMQAFVSSVGLFSLPTFVLGVVTPYLARMNITDVKTSGKRLASINSAETIGSLTGTFLTGFYLFGVMGTNSLLVLLPLLLLASTFLVDVRPYLIQRVILSAAILVTFLLPPPVEFIGLVDDIDTAYSRYLVRDIVFGDSFVRVLQNDSDSLQSGVYADGRKDLVFGYTRAFEYFSSVNPNAERSLIIGGGAFTFPEVLARNNPDATVDVIEIDDSLPAISRQYFNFNRPANLNIFTADGRQFLNTTDTKYDVAYVDAFAASVPPFQLVTKESFEKVKKVTKPGGYVVVNVIGGLEGKESRFTSHMQATLGEVYKRVHIYQVSPGLSPEGRQNLIFVASDEVINRSNVDKIAAASPEFKAILDTETSLAINKNEILTDNFAPVDQLVK